MTTSITSVARTLGALSLAAVVAIEPAIAGTAIPAPVLGLGAPVLALFAGGYWLIRRRRSR